MIDYQRPHEPAMYLPAAPTDHAPLDDFQVFNKKWTTYTYTDYYSAHTFDAYMEPEIDPSAANIYHDLGTAKPLSAAHRDVWKCKYIADWTEDDTLYWLLDAARNLGISEYDLNTYNFRIPGVALRGLRKEQIIEMLLNPVLEPFVSRRNAELMFERLQHYLNDEASRDANARYDYQHPQELTDLDLLDHRKKLYEYNLEAQEIQRSLCDSSDDADDYPRTADAGSPECFYGSDVSKSGDESDGKRKVIKRPPGRPKGSGRKVIKRPRSVSVPEFLRNLLLDPKYCPKIIRWEDHSRGMFRFVKPDEVAKLWGLLKQNDNMTFEKFSRAMRYHYRQSVLVSVPTLRLVYQFGPKGPDYKTDNPNFTKVKSELDVHNENRYP